MNFKFKKLLIVAFFIVFLFLGITAMNQGMATAKNERVYSLLKEHNPYSIQKRVGGFSILMKGSDVKEKPPAKEIFIRFEQLEKQWAAKALKLDGNILSVQKDGKILAKITLLNQEEVLWVKEYYEIK